MAVEYLHKQNENTNHQNVLHRKMIIQKGLLITKMQQLPHYRNSSEIHSKNRRNRDKIDIALTLIASPIRRGFVAGFVNYKKWCTRLADESDKVDQLLAHGRWFSLGTTKSTSRSL
jgi:hypothetical protein